MGSKADAKSLMALAGVPVVPGLRRRPAGALLPEAEGLRDRLPGADQSVAGAGGAADCGGCFSKALDFDNAHRCN